MEYGIEFYGEIQLNLRIVADKKTEFKDFFYRFGHKELAHLPKAKTA